MKCFEGLFFSCHVNGFILSVEFSCVATLQFKAESGGSGTDYAGTGSWEVNCIANCHFFQCCPNWGLLRIIFLHISLLFANCLLTFGCKDIHFVDYKQIVDTKI